MVDETRNVEYRYGADPGELLTALNIIAGTALRTESALMDIGKGGSQGLGKVESKGKAVVVTGKAIATTFTAVLASVVAAGAGIAKFTIDTARGLRQVKREAEAIGATAEDYQKVGGALEQLSGDGFDAADALAELNIRLGDAREGGNDYSRVLDAMGLSASALLAMPLDERLLSIASAFEKLENDADRARAAEVLFGDEASKKLIPALRQGRDALKAQFDEMARGGVVSNTTAASAEALANSVDLLKRRGKAMLIEAVAPLNPELEQLATGIGNVMAEARDNQALGALRDQLVDIAIGAARAVDALLGLGLFDAALSTQNRLQKELTENLSRMEEIEDAIERLNTGPSALGVMGHGAQRQERINELMLERVSLAMRNEDVEKELTSLQSERKRKAQETLKVLKEQKTATVSLKGTTKENKEEVKETQALWSSIGGIVSDLADKVKGATKGLVDAAGVAGAKIGKSFKFALSGQSGGVLGEINTIVQSVQGVVDEALGNLSDMFREQTEERVRLAEQASVQIQQIERRLARETDGVERRKLVAELQRRKKERSDARKGAMEAFRRQRAIAIISNRLNQALSLIHI